MKIWIPRPHPRPTDLWDRVATLHFFVCFEQILPLLDSKMNTLKEGCTQKSYSTLLSSPSTPLQCPKGNHHFICLLCILPVHTKKYKQTFLILPVHTEKYRPFSCLLFLNKRQLAMRITPCLPSNRVVSPLDPLMENPWTQRTNGPSSSHTREYLWGTLDAIPHRF